MKENRKIFLVGTCCEANQSKLESEAKALSSSNKYQYFSVSSKSGVGISSLLGALATTGLREI